MKINPKSDPATPEILYHHWKEPVAGNDLEGPGPFDAHEFDLSEELAVQTVALEMCAFVYDRRDKIKSSKAFRFVKSIPGKIAEVLEYRP